MDGGDSARSLLENKFTSLTGVKSGWFADAADFIILLCSFLLTTASIVLVILIFYVQANPDVALDPVLSIILSILQRAISALSITITSAVIIVAGKRYVLFKLSRGGIRSRRVAVYSRPSIGNLAYHLAWHGLELPLLALSVIWILGLVTGLTVNDAWAMLPVVSSMPISIPFGPFDASQSNTLVAPGSQPILASGQLSYVIASVCWGMAGAINIIDGARLATGSSTGSLLYPPLPDYIPNTGFSLSTSLNGFNISVEPLSSIPPTAQNLTCADSTGGFSTGQLWYEGGDNQTLIIIATLPNSQALYRFTASAIVLGGTLRSTGDVTQFVSNGTTWPNVMSNDTWTQDIANLVCNATSPFSSSCPDGGLSFLDSAMALDAGYGPLGPSGADSSTLAGAYWSTALGMAMGAYSALWSTNHLVPDVPITFYDSLQFTPCYGVYILIANIVVSVIMFVVVVRLRMASHLGGDFIDPTRLLLDPLKNVELFNAPLNTTMDALANPYMLVREDSKFLLVEQASWSEETSKW